MTELYKATFAYDTDKEDELSLKVGETVRVSNKDSSDWWVAERVNNSKEIGLVPSNFLEKIPEEGIVLAIVTKDYLSQSPEELSLQKNRIVTILSKDIGEGWWQGDLNGKTGIFPADHVELVQESELPGDDDSKAKKDSFKLAAYGVKQGGIGSILAGGFSLKRTSTNSNRSSANDRPTSTNTESNVPSIPNKPHPSLIKSNNNPPVPTTTKKTLSSRAMVLHDYLPESNDEIKLMRGEYVTVVDQLDNDGWWKGTSESGETGLFPSTFVQILQEDKPPQRPVRARPATVKTDTAPSPAPAEGMARPPPVPVTTRPTSLLTQREGSSMASPPPRPITTPPRPMTTPPVPAARRTNSIASPPPIDIGHRRIPSIPVMSPDLPPMSPIHDKPTRPIPRPTSTTSSDSFRAKSPEAHQNALNHMAKPPKINFGTKMVPQSPATSRPVSTNEDQSLPPVPKRSMPPLPESSILPIYVDQNPAPTTSAERKPAPQHLPSTPDLLIDAKIKQYIQFEIEKIKQEFESKLEQERVERQKIQVELDALKSTLN